MEKVGILKSTIQVSVALLIVKLLGVLKQSLIAAYCGATAETDAYFIATGVTVALCTVIFSSVSISLLSMHTERLIVAGRKSSNNMINAALHVLIPVSLAITVFFAVGSPIVAKFLAPSYQNQQLQTLSVFLRAMSPMFIFTCYSLIINVVLETDKQFLPGKGRNFFPNLFVCIAAVAFYPKFGIQTLIYAFLLAGFAQCVQISWSARRNFHFVTKPEPEKESVSKLLHLALPLLAGNAIYEINDIVDKQIATGLGHGNVSFLSYGASINEIVTTLIIQSVSTVLFSHYATWAAEGNTKKIGENLKKSLEYLVALIMPIMIMCFVCGRDIVDVLYGRGNFGSSAIKATAGVVLGYASGFLFQAARANLIRAYYAFQDTRTPMVNGIIAVTANIALSILLSKTMGAGGIALATSISMLLVTVLLLPGISKYIHGFSLKTSLPEYTKCIITALIVSIFAYLIRSAIPFGSFLSLLIVGLFTVTAYCAAAYFMKVNTVRSFSQIIRCKIARN